MFSRSRVLQTYGELCGYFSEYVRKLSPLHCVVLDADVKYYFKLDKEYSSVIPSR
jgi:hypothetical protein